MIGNRMTRSAIITGSGTVQLEAVRRFFKYARQVFAREPNITFREPVIMMVKLMLGGWKHPG